MTQRVHRHGVKRRSPKQWIWLCIKMIILIFLCFYLVFPCLTILSNAFKTQGEILLAQPTLIPKRFTLGNFTEIFNDKAFTTGLLNSLKLGLINMVLVMCIAVPSAYAIARIRSKAAGVMQVWVFAAQMIPGIILAVPLYGVLLRLGIFNTHRGLLLVYLVSNLPVSTWMLIGFVRTIPREIEEAAFIDGCNIVMMILRVLLPSMLPGLFTAMIMVFIGTWNEYFYALCLVKDPSLSTLAIKLRTYLGLSGEARKGMLAAGSLIATIPGLLIFTFFQRYYVQGAMAGSVKG